MSPAKPRANGSIIRQEDHGAVVLASVKELRIAIREGVRIRFPTQSIRFIFSRKVDSLI